MNNYNTDVILAESLVNNPSLDYNRCFDGDSEKQTIDLVSEVNGIGNLGKRP